VNCILLRLIFLNTSFTKEPVARAIRKNDPDFFNWLNEFLKEIKQGQLLMLGSDSTGDPV